MTKRILILICSTCHAEHQAAAIRADVVELAGDGMLRIRTPHSDELEMIELAHDLSAIEAGDALEMRCGCPTFSRRFALTGSSPLK